MMTHRRLALFVLGGDIEDVRDVVAREVVEEEAEDLLLAEVDREHEGRQPRRRVGDVGIHGDGHALGHSTRVVALFQLRLPPFELHHADDALPLEGGLELAFACQVDLANEPMQGGHAVGVAHVRVAAELVQIAEGLVLSEPHRAIDRRDLVVPSLLLEPRKFDGIVWELDSVLQAVIFDDTFVQVVASLWRLPLALRRLDPPGVFVCHHSGAELGGRRAGDAR